MKIAITGDVMLGRLVDEYVIRDTSRPADACWGNTLPLLHRADLRFINLECVISNRGSEWRPESKAFHFRAHPRAIEALLAAQIDAVSLANNHSLDYGAEALEECLRLLDHAGIRHAGAGLNLEQALGPAILESRDSRIALIALTDNEPEWEATPLQAGVNHVQYDRQGLIEPYQARIDRAIQQARREAPFVIISAHVGPNWGIPSQPMQALAHRLIDMGADLYWGHSNHTPQGIELYNGRAILYSTGDFIDDYMVHPDERNDLSFLFLLDIHDRRLTRIDLHPVIIHQYTAQRAGPAEVEYLKHRMCERSRRLGTDVVFTGNIGSLIVR